MKIGYKFVAEYENIAPLICNRTYENFSECADDAKRLNGEGKYVKRVWVYEFHVYSFGDFYDTKQTLIFENGAWRI